MHARRTAWTNEHEVLVGMTETVRRSPPLLLLSIQRSMNARRYEHRDRTELTRHSIRENHSHVNFHDSAWSCWLKTGRVEMKTAELSPAELRRNCSAKVSSVSSCFTRSNCAGDARVKMWAVRTRVRYDGSARSAAAWGGGGGETVPCSDAQVSAHGERGVTCSAQAQRGGAPAKVSWIREHARARSVDTLQSPCSDSFSFQEKKRKLQTPRQRCHLDFMCHLCLHPPSSSSACWFQLSAPRKSALELHLSECIRV